MTEIEKNLVTALQYLHTHLPQSKVLVEAVEVIDVEICKVIAKRALEEEFGVPKAAVEAPLDKKVDADE